MALQTGDLILSYYPDDVSCPKELLAIKNVFDRTFTLQKRLTEYNYINNNFFKFAIGEIGTSTNDAFDVIHDGGNTIEYVTDGSFNAIGSWYKSDVDYQCAYADLKKSQSYWLKIQSVHEANSTRRYLAVLVPQKVWYDFVHESSPSKVPYIADTSEFFSDARIYDSTTLIALYDWKLSDGDFDKYVYVPSGYEFVIFGEYESDPSNNVSVNASASFNDDDYNPAYQYSFS